MPKAPQWFPHIAVRRLAYRGVENHAQGLLTFYWIYRLYLSSAYAVQSNYHHQRYISRIEILDSGEYHWGSRWHSSIFFPIVEFLVPIDRSSAQTYLSNFTINLKQCTCSIGNPLVSIQLIEAIKHVKRRCKHDIRNELLIVTSITNQVISWRSFKLYM